MLPAVLACTYLIVGAGAATAAASSCSVHGGAACYAEPAGVDHALLQQAVEVGRHYGARRRAPVAVAQERQKGSDEKIDYEDGDDKAKVAKRGKAALQAPWKKSGECTPGSDTDISSGYCCCNLGAGRGEIVKGPMSLSTYSCRDTACAPAPEVRPPDQAWVDRFKDAKWDMQNFAGPNKLFTQGEWEAAVTADGSFGREALTRQDPTPHPQLGPSITRPCVLSVPLETWDSFRAKYRKGNPTSPVPVRDADTGMVRLEHCGNMAYNRAMSLANLRKVRNFIQNLAGTRGYIVNPDLERGRACRTDPVNSPCFDKKKCLKLCGRKYDGSPDTVQHQMPPEKVSMYVLDAILVRPLTYYTESSLVGHIGGGTPHVFISHAWGGRFYDFMAAAEAHYTAHYSATQTPEQTYYWVCTFALNQHNAAYEVGEDVFGPFFYGIQLAHRVFAIQDDEMADTWFTLYRPWCVFEMMVTFEFEKELEFGCRSGAMFGQNGWLPPSTPRAAARCDTKLRDKILGFTVDNINYDQKQDIIKGYIKSKGCDVLRGMLWAAPADGVLGPWVPPLDAMEAREQGSRPVDSRVSTLQAPGRTSGECKPGSPTDVSSGYCCCAYMDDQGRDKGWIMKGEISYPSYTCRDDACEPEVPSWDKKFQGIECLEEAMHKMAYPIIPGRGRRAGGQIPALSNLQGANAAASPDSSPAVPPDDPLYGFQGCMGTQEAILNCKAQSH